MKRTTRVAIAVALGLLVGVFRFLSVAGFSNDHYMHVAAGQQIAMGEWPSRDFVEIGLPLMELLSAIPFWVVPEAPLFGEALLVAFMFGLAAVFTLYAARRLTGSWWIAALVVALEVVIFPRTYSYPKILAYAAGFLAMWRYVERPSLSRMAQLALVVVLAFGLRYDHGFYLGVGGLLTVVLVAMTTDGKTVMRRATTFGGVVLLLLSPYIVFVATHDGLWRHIMRGIEMQAVESSRGRTIPEFAFDGSLLNSNAVPWLFFFFHLLPVCAAIVVWMRWPRHPHPLERSMVVPLIVVAVLANVGLIRDTVSARLPDAIVPVSLLLGWLLAGAVRVHSLTGRGVAWVAATAMVTLTLASATVISSTREQLEKAELLSGPARLWEHLRSRTTELHQRFPRSQMPSAVASALLPFLEYSDRCLDRRDHILIPAYAPEVFVWARRPFAGGQVWFQPELLTRDEDHREVMGRLETQRVPVAVLLSPSAEGVLARFDELGVYLEQHLPIRVSLKTEDGRAITLAFSQDLAVGRDSATGWSCYR